MMRQGRYCIVCGTTDWSVAQYSLPVCPERRAKWLSILKVNPCYINSRSRVCSKHFARNQLIRDRLKADALPKPLISPSQGISRLIKKDNKTKSEGGIWHDKINLNGRCVFCLEPLKSKSTQRNAHWTSTSLSHLWPYLQLNGPTTQDFYIGINDNDNELIFSQIPQICALCLQNINILNSLHHDLEVIKQKLREQEKLVNSAAGRIRETVANSVKFRKRNKLQEELVKSKIPMSCISSTTKFLDSLLPDPGSSTVMIVNLTPQVTIEESQEDYIIVNSVPDQHNLETNSTVNNYPEDLTFSAIPAEKTTAAVFDTVLPDPVNVKIELPEETEGISNTDPMHVHVKTELNSDDDNEMDGLSIQTQTGPKNISNNLKSKKCTSTISSQSDKHWKTSDSDHDKRKNCSSGTHLSHTKSYPNQISFLPDDEQLIDVPCSPHSNENTTVKDADPLYDDPLGDT